MLRLKTLLTVIGAVTVLVLAGNTVAVATTGHGFILGKVNKANRATVLKRTTSGPALSLVAKPSGSAPFAVNTAGKVANLNADQVDGLDSSQLRTATYVFTHVVSVAATDVSVPISLPAGTYLMTYSTYMSGGGGAGGQSACYFERAQGGATTYFAMQKGPTASSVNPAMSGSGVLSVGPGVTLDLYCYSSAAWTNDASLPIQITATPTTVAGGGSLRVATGTRLAPPR